MVILCILMVALLQELIEVDKQGGKTEGNSDAHGSVNIHMAYMVIVRDFKGNKFHSLG